MQWFYSFARRRYEALPNLIVLIGAARSYDDKPQLQSQPAMPPWLHDREGISRYAVPADSAPIWRSSAIAEETVERCTALPRWGKVYQKPARLEHWPYGFHNVAIWIKGKGTRGGAGAQRKRTRQKGKDAIAARGSVNREP